MNYARYPKIQHCPVKRVHEKQVYYTFTLAGLEGGDKETQQI